MSLQKARGRFDAMWYEEERDDITVEDMCKRYIQEYARDPVNGY